MKQQLISFFCRIEKKGKIERPVGKFGKFSLIHSKINFCLLGCSALRLKSLNNAEAQQTR
jgi:hypothetical protein